MDYTKQLVICGGKGELRQYLRSDKFSLLVSVVDTRELPSVLPANIGGIRHVHTDLFAGNLHVVDAALRAKLVDKMLRVVAPIKDALENRQKVVVHCAAGLHRSPCVALAALLYLGVPDSLALKTLYQIRPMANCSGPARIGLVAAFQNDILNQDTIQGEHAKQRVIVTVADQLGEFINLNYVQDMSQAYALFRQGTNKLQLARLANNAVIPYEDSARQLQWVQRHVRTYCGTTLLKIVKHRMAIL